MLGCYCSVDGIAARWYSDAGSYLEYFSRIVKRETCNASVMRDKVALMITGVAVLVAMIAIALALTPYPDQSGDLAAPIPQEPANGTVVGIAPHTTDLLSDEDAVVIALNQTGLLDERDKVEQIFIDRFYVDETGQVYSVNSGTLEMRAADDKPRVVEKLAKFDREAHYWVISLYMGIDSGYVVILDAFDGDVEDISPYIV